jgi:uncharacterized membrane protein
MSNLPFFTNDTVVFGILMLILGLIFYTSSSKDKAWVSFYKYVPALLLAYFIPAILSTSGLIAYEVENEMGEVIHKSQIYYIASRYLLPASLVLMTLSIDLKAVFSLGSKALIMFLTGTVGIIIGGPIAIMLIAYFSPETVGGAGVDAVWRGLATLAGSWIGGGANQAAMLEVYEYNQAKYAGMVVVDIVVANLWMAILLFGIGKNKAIDKWLNADTTAIESLKEKVIAFSKKTEKIPTLTDYIIMLALAFGAVGFAHYGANFLSKFLVNNFEAVANPKSFLSFMSSSFFWMITLATLIGIAASFTNLKKLEGAGASKLGSVFIYILVVSIGMRMDLRMAFENPMLIVVGIVWMTVHALLLIGVAKLIKAPFFFLAVGSQANVGGAASAPIVAAAFHPALATVGVLLAVFGYVIGTFGAILTAELMHIVAPV